MTIEEQRKAFERFCTKDDKFCIHRYEGDPNYSDDYTQCAWLAWLASANQEGYKLVPVETLEESLSWASIAKWDSPSKEMDLEIEKHEKIIEAMIGACDDH